jgi:hypothetical protein
MILPREVAERSKHLIVTFTPVVTPNDKAKYVLITNNDGYMGVVPRRVFLERNYFCMWDYNGGFQVIVTDGSDNMKSEIDRGLYLELLSFAIQVADADTSYEEILSKFRMRWIVQDKDTGKCEPYSLVPVDIHAKSTHPNNGYSKPVWQTW